jgi:hypothetical protein
VPFLPSGQVCTTSGSLATRNLLTDLRGIKVGKEVGMDVGKASVPGTLPAAKVLPEPLLYGPEVPA